MVEELFDCLTAVCFVIQYDTVNTGGITRGDGTVSVFKRLACCKPHIYNILL